MQDFDEINALAKHISSGIKQMKRQFILLFILLAVVACKTGSSKTGSSGGGCPDVSVDVTLMENKVYELFPDFETYSVHNKVAVLRNHVHSLSDWGDGWIAKSPFRYEYYRRLAAGEIDGLCGDRAYAFGALLLSVGFDARLVSLASDTAYQGSWGHIVTEVYIDSKWEFHDPMFNLRAEYEGNRLSCKEVHQHLLSGEAVDFISDGFSVRPEAELDKSIVPFDEYFDSVDEHLYPPIFECW